MELKINQNGEALEISVTGSLNAQTAPALAQKISENEDGIQEMVLDFAGLDYISSAGLRVILTAQNKMDDIGGKLTIKHAGATVREVFDMTGFTSILTLE